MLLKASLTKTARTLLPVIVAAFFCVPAARALSRSYYHTHSKLSTGKWVKVKITDRGVYEITYDQLRQWGFENPEDVNVYGYGGAALTDEQFSTSIPDDVKMTHTLHRGNKLYFYATGDVDPIIVSIKNVNAPRNYYSTDTYYLLSDRTPDDDEVKDNIAVNEDNTTALDAHLALEYVEEELQHPSTGGALYFGKDVPTDGSLDLPFTVRNMGVGNTEWNTASMRATFAALCNRNTIMTVNTPQSLDDKNVITEYAQIPSASAEYTRYRTGGYVTKTFNADGVADGEYVFSAVHPNGNQTFLAVDASWLIYPRLSILPDDVPALEMNYLLVNESSNFTIKASPTTCVFNTSEACNIFAHNTTYDSETGIMTGTFDRSYYSSTAPTCRLVAFDTEKTQKSVTYVGNVANQNLHATTAPEMLIITTEALRDAAEELAEAHRQYDGMDVLVVTSEAIYNEFSSATPDAMAYRRLAKMFYDRSSHRFHYIILYGASFWDNRRLTYDLGDRLLCYETTNSAYAQNDTKSFVSDCFFGMLDDATSANSITQGLLTIPVGRIPVTNIGDARSVNNKIIRHLKEQTPASAFAGTMILADDGDNNLHARQAQDIAKNISNLHPANTTIRAYNGIYEWENSEALILRDVVSNGFKRGLGLAYFIGHNDDAYFGAEKLWTFDAVNNLSYSVLPMMMLSTCDAYGFDLNKKCLAETLLFKEDGGALAVIASARVVYGNSNQDLAYALSTVYANARPGDTTGDLWLRARNNAVTIPAATNSTRVNTLCYNLCGDPALKVAAVDYNITVTAVNGAAVTDDAKIALQPLTPFTVEGNITDTDGNVITDFNGTVELRLFDTPYTVATMPRTHASTDPAIDITLDQDILASKTVTVTDGHFNATIIAPLPVHETTADDSFNRLTLHADNNTDGKRADGCLTTLQIATTDNDEPVISTLPQIDYLAVNNTANPDGATVSGDITILAAGQTGDAGLNVSSAIGAVSTLIIDGTTRIEDMAMRIATDTDNHWSLKIPVDNLTDGLHSAVLTICDNLGNTATASVSFILNNTAAYVTITADRTLTNGTVTVDIEHSIENVTGNTVIVENRFGKHVAAFTNATFPLTINFADIDGGQPDGYYLIHAQVRGENNHGASTPVGITYIKSDAKDEN